MPGRSQTTCDRPMTEATLITAEQAAIISAAAVTFAFCGSFLLLLVAAAFQR